jgi:hypothetical protein
MQEELDLMPELEINGRPEDKRDSETLQDKLDRIDFNQMKQFNPNLVGFKFDKVKGESCVVELEVCG